MKKAVILTLAAIFSLSGLELLGSSQVTGKQTLVVAATAYNSLPEPYTGQEAPTAWGHKLEPGNKVISVSRDLVDLGLVDGVVVEIEGLPGKYLVADKMARRWTKKIDIYMGLDEVAAKEWGNRTVKLTW